MVSIAMALATSRAAVGSLILVPAGDQVYNKTGSHAAHRDSSRDAQQCDTNAAVGTAAQDESDATGNRQRGQRFLFYVFADVAIPPTLFLIVFHCAGSC
jgi:hypothetical protein